jgi:WD40 repeat protein
LSPNGKRVVSGSEDGAVRLWDLDTGKVIAKWTEHTRNIRSVCWNRDYERVVSGYFDGTARVWDVESGKTVLEIESGLNEVWEAIYSPDTTMIAIGGDSEEKEFISIWNANTGKLVTKLKGHTQRVKCLAWTPDGTALISGSFDYSVRTWNTTTWQQIAVLTDHYHYVYDGAAIAISSNGRILASASWIGEVQLWDFQNGQPIGSSLLAQRAYYVMNSMSFSIDGKLLR